MSVKSDVFYGCWKNSLCIGFKIVPAIFLIAPNKSLQKSTEND